MAQCETEKGFYFIATVDARYTLANKEGKWLGPLREINGNPREWYQDNFVPLDESLNPMSA
jgi:hypothetical protein